MAISSLNDILNEVLANRNELPHFWFNESLFQPFSTVILSDACGEDEQEHVSIYITCMTVIFLEHTDSSPTLVTVALCIGHFHLSVR